MKTTLKLMALMIITIGYVTTAHADDPLPDFFCATDPGRNSGFVDITDKLCTNPAGAYAAKTDSEGKILCIFTSQCLFVTPELKSAIETLSHKSYASLSDEDRFNIIKNSNMYGAMPVPPATIMCNVKTDPCQPVCPSVHDCADPKKGGSNHVMRLLPADARGTQVFERDPGGNVRKNNTSGGSAQ